MHFSVLLIHEWDENSVMGKRNYDADEEVGAELEFVVDTFKKDAEKEYKNYIKKNPDKKEEYPNLDAYMEGEYSYLKKNKDGDYGTMSNSYGMYDWYCVGGRWANCLPNSNTIKEYKAIVKKAINLKDDKIREKYANNVAEYVKISEMNPKDACAYLQIGGTNSLMIGETSADKIIEWWKLIIKSWDRVKGEVDAAHTLFNTIIIETDDEEEMFHDNDENINEEFFKEKYEYYLKLSKEENREFFITVLDLHT